MQLVSVPSPTACGRFPSSLFSSLVAFLDDVAAAAVSIGAAIFIYGAADYAQNFFIMICSYACKNYYYAPATSLLCFHYAREYY